METIYNLLGFIPTYDSQEEFNKKSNEGVIIDYSQLFPILQYKTKTDSGKEQWSKIDGSDSPLRLAKLSDLDYFLRERDWNIGFGRKVTNKSSDETEDNLFLYNVVKSATQLINFNENEDSLIDFPIVSDSYNDLEEESLFNHHYEVLMNIKPMDYKDNLVSKDDLSVNLGSIYYYNLISSRNLEEGSTIVDLLSLNDSNYTNILNLNGLVPVDADGNFTRCNCLLTFGVECTISESEVGYVFPKEISLNPFEVTDDGSFRSSSYIINVSENATIDYHDLCLRVFPNNSNVNECIISYCYITYDEL